MTWPVGYTEDTTSNTEWTSVSSQDLVGAGSYFLLQLQSHSGEKNWIKDSTVSCGGRIDSAFQAPARDSSRVRCRVHVAKVLASIAICNFISIILSLKPLRLARQPNISKP
jgi:hypothetical protein